MQSFEREIIVMKSDAQIGRGVNPHGDFLSSRGFQQAAVGLEEGGAEWPWEKAGREGTWAGLSSHSGPLTPVSVFHPGETDITNTAFTRGESSSARHIGQCWDSDPRAQELSHLLSMGKAREE